ncbi:WD40 repeat-like protein [Sphaerulina musiva SO2202]|uniref:WD40 repeat-like protein n=1 Tax=Sphaerulina musiva (strain SO2202) TaxID=692275 RepID=N1QGR6_SPHMS|nr:WD40 repeat-like protein [Sphaerulina musiva SO2202]EMF09194.1 WD40 repeat-like protein [Sphaerulina musiva SO2202]
MSSPTDTLHPKCIATTGDEFHHRTRTSHSSHLSDESLVARRSNIFRKALFTPDGTSIVTHTEDNCLRTFVLPPELLDERYEPLSLNAYATWQSGSNVQSYAVYPGFDLQDPTTTFVLTGSASVPVTLRNALDYNSVQASYPLIHRTTEEYQPPRSLAWTRDGLHFLVGSDNLLAGFDCSQAGQGPTIFHKLKAGRKSSSGLQMLQRKGLVSSLSISNDGLLALGTNEREIAMYDNDGLGSWVSSFELEEGLGTGISDLKWSPCGKHLLIAERQSNVIQMYDIRNTQQKVGDLTGRYAATPQVMNIDVVPTASGYEVWGGSTDGTVRMWSNPGDEYGGQMPSATLKLHGSPVSSAIWHPSGAILATASGRRFDDTTSTELDKDSGLSDLKQDSSLKIWTV